MSIYYEKARELGELILQSDEAIALNNARLAFQNDEEAKAQMEEYKIFQENVQESMEEAVISKEDLTKATEKLQEMGTELKKIPTVSALIHHETKFNVFVNQVMSVLKYTITGESQNNDGCPSGGCHNKSCSDCH